MSGLSLPPGVVRGATPYDIPGAWWDTNLIRWQEGRMRPIGGWQRITSSPFASPVRQVKVWRTNDDRLLYAVGTEVGIQVRADAFVDVTPAALVTFRSPFATGFGVGAFGAGTFGTPRTVVSSTIASRADQWSFDNWGQDLLAVSSADGRLLQYVGANLTPAQMTVVSGAPTGNRGVLVTDERHVVLIGCGGYPRRVGWSSRESLTDWNFSSTTNTAGFLDLEATSMLIAAVRVREGFLVFSDREVWLFRYVGEPYIYGKELLGKIGLLNARMVVPTSDGGAFWMADNAFWQYQGGAVSRVKCPLSSDVFTNINLPFTRAFGHGCAVQKFPEAWWWYCSPGSTEPDRYVIFNFSEKWWARGAMTRRAAAGANGDDYWYGADEVGHIHQHENGWTAAGVPLTAQRFAETAAFKIDISTGIKATRALLSTGVGVNAIELRFYGRQTPEGSEVAFGPYAMRADGYADLRINARSLRMRVEGLIDAEWSFGAADIDYGPDGRGR